MRLFSQSNSLRLTWKDSVMAQNVSVMEKCFLGLIFCIKPRKKMPAGIQAYCLYCSIPRPPRCTLGLQTHSFCSGWRSEKLPSGSTWRELRYLCQISVSGEIKMCHDAYLVFGPENAVGFFWLLSLKARSLSFTSFQSNIHPGDQTNVDPFDRQLVPLVLVADL